MLGESEVGIKFFRYDVISDAKGKHLNLCNIFDKGVMYTSKLSKNRLPNTRWIAASPVDERNFPLNLTVFPLVNPSAPPLYSWILS